LSDDVGILRGMCIDCNLYIVLCTILGTLLCQHVHRFLHMSTHVWDHTHMPTPTATKNHLNLVIIIIKYCNYIIYVKPVTIMSSERRLLFLFPDPLCNFIQVLEFWRHLFLRILSPVPHRPGLNFITLELWLLQYLHIVQECMEHKR